MTGDLTHEERQIFQDFIHEDEEYDRGIELFENAMKNAQDMLNTSGGRDAGVYDTVFDQLNEEWNYFGLPAILTGKLYCSEDDVTFAPDEWGEMRTDSEGNYYLVENVDVISHGIVDVGEATNDDSDTFVQFAYGFSPEDMESDRALFYAFPEDVLTAKYEVPTLEAISARLHHRWPQEMLAVDKLITPGERNLNLLIERLGHVTKRLTKAAESDDFLIWLTYYLYDRIEFDKECEYAIKCRGPAWYIDSGGSLIPFEFNEPKLNYMRVCGLTLSHDEDNNEVVSAITFLRLAASESPEYFTEQIVIPSTSIADFRSTRSRQSLFESLVTSRLEWSDDYIPEEIEGAFIEDVKKESVELTPVCEFDRLLKLEEAVKQAKALVARARQSRYTSENAAVRESELLAAEIHDLFQSVRLQSGDIMRVTGGGVGVPQANLRSKGGSITVETVDNGKPHPLAAGDEADGEYLGMNVAIREYYDEDNDEIFHLAHPQLCLTTKDIRINLSGDNYPLLPLRLQKNALVNLDGSADISVPRLDKLRQQRSALAAIALAHRKERIVGDVKALDQAFVSESDVWEDLTNTARLRRVAQEIQSNPHEHSDTLEFLHQLLGGRRLRIVGDYSLDGTLHERETIEGRAVGVTTIYPGVENDAPAIAIVDESRPDQPPLYMAMSTITEFAF